MDGLMPPAIVPKKVKETDYSKFTVEQIKAQLEQRGLPTNGKRKALVRRLKAEVQRAWQNYYQAKGGAKPLFDGKKKKKSNKPKPTPEELTAKLEKEKAERLAKLKRKAENIKKMEEAREAKRQKKEQSAALQKERMEQQKVDKMERQKLECFVNFDLKNFQQQLMKKVDPKGDKVSSLSYNAVNKRFNIRFKDADDQVTYTKGSTIKKPKKFDLKMTLSLLPAPVESRCVMFLYPGALNHPDKEEAASWLESQSSESMQDLSALKYWVDSAFKTFSKFGKVVNIYRERGFLVIQFSADSEAKKMMAKSGESFNGVRFIHKQTGTPTKAAKNAVTKEYPMPSLKTKKE